MTKVLQGLCSFVQVFEKSHFCKSSTNSQSRIFIYAPFPVAKCPAFIYQIKEQWEKEENEQHS